MLRTRCSRDIDKTCLILLCRLWGYRSEQWQPRGDQKRRRRSPTPSQSPPSSALALPPVPRLPLPPVCTLDAASLRGFISSQLEPLLRASSLAFEGPRSRESTLSDGQAPFTLSSLDSYAAMTALCAAMHARWASAAAAQRSWAAPAMQSRALCGAPAEPETAAAWQLLPFCAEEGGAAEHLREFAEMLKAGMRMLRGNRPELVLGGRAAASPPPGFTVAQDEFSNALRDGNAFHAGAQLLLAQLHAGSSLEVYVAGSEALLFATAVYMADTSAAYVRRRDWSAAVLRDRAAQPMELRTGPDQNYRAFFGVKIDEVLGSDGPGSGMVGAAV